MQSLELRGVREPWVFAIQSNENNQLVNLIIDFVRTLKTNKFNRQDSHLKVRAQKNFLRGIERSLRETGDRNRIYNSYTRTSADSRRSNYDSRTRLPTPGEENRSRDRSHESSDKQPKPVVSFKNEQCRRCGQRNHAFKEGKK